ncbi:SDR family oxidoreductase [Streptomyces sp. NPDC006265]|uniref:SDR family oxidoreductase n=1 Tax=Streptomyces sp. NPDC006265 TaxID=3156740 RepID=UPI0033A6CF80
MPRWNFHECATEEVAGVRVRVCAPDDVPCTHRCLGASPARQKAGADRSAGWFLVMKHLMPLAPQSGASMVCVSSRLGMVGMPNQTLYSAAKGGLSRSRAAPPEWADRGIRVSRTMRCSTLQPPARGRCRLVEAGVSRKGRTPGPLRNRRTRRTQG